jgi:hypothetical protein
MNCEARKGFLTLSPCENPAATTCAHCARSLCPAHLAPPHFTMCLDCAATNQQADPNQPQNENEYDDTWAHGYRSSYYTSTGYVAGSSRDPYYDSQDTSSFKDRGNDDFGDETVRDGFGES